MDETYFPLSIDTIISTDSIIEEILVKLKEYSLSKA